jgi:PncC family amidohydrolase
MAISDLDIVKRVHEFFKTRGLTLAVAESCTGGMVGHLLTSLPGASLFFDSSMVCYSARSKEKVLGLGNSFIKKHGTISEDTARAMAEAAKKVTGSDIAVAVTGNLGPEPIEDRSVGIVYIAVALDIETTSGGFFFEGTREEMKRSASEEVLHFLFQAVSIWK